MPYPNIKELIDAGKEAGLQEVKLVPDTKKAATGTATTAPAPLAPAQAMKTDPIMAPRPAVPPTAKLATVPDAPAEDTAASATAPVPAGPISPCEERHGALIGVPTRRARG